MENLNISNLFGDIDEMFLPLFEGAKYPFEILGNIGDFIKKLGPTLDKDIYENKGEYSHEKAAEMSLEYAVSSISVPFHPGAERYYKEVGAIS